jgi:hypothetical protein
MRTWFDSLSANERLRRKSFSTEFAHDQKALRDHYLTTERDVTVHRLGFPDVKVEVRGPFGRMHTATPTTRISGAESRPLEPDIGNDPALQWAATLPPSPVRTPLPDQFTVGPAQQQQGEDHDQQQHGGGGDDHGQRLRVTGHAAA